MEFKLQEDKNFNEYVLFLSSKFRNNGRISFPESFYTEDMLNEINKLGISKDEINIVDIIKSIDPTKFDALNNQFKNMAEKSGMIYFGFSNSCIVMVDGIILVEKIKEKLIERNTGVLKRIIITDVLKEKEILVAPLNDENLEKYLPNKETPEGFDCFEDHCSEYNFE